MSIAIMAPISTHHQYQYDLATSPPPTTLELSRSTATYFAQSSRHSLPSPSLPSWSLHRSYGSSRNSFTATKHLRSSRLIDDDPDRAEEDHMRGVKRNRRGMRMTTAHPSPTAKASPVKRQCRTNLMLPLYKPSNAKQQSEGSSFGMRPSQQDSAASSILGTKQETPSEIVLLPKRLAKPRTSSPSPSLPPRSKHCHDSNDVDSKKDPPPLLDDNDDDDDDEFAHCVPPTRPLLRRRSTIRDSFDLACSMEEFASLLAS